MGGTDWTSELLASTDLNDTINSTVELAAVGVAQNAYQTLQANNVFENKDFLVADEFTDSNGTNNTVNTGSSTSSFNSPGYILSINDVSGGDTTHDPNSYSNPSNAFDGNISTSAVKTVSTGALTTSLGKTFTTKTVFAVRTKASVSMSTSSPSSTIKLQSYNGTSWSDVATLDSSSSSSASVNVVTILNSSVQGLRLNISTTTGSASTHSHNVQIIEYGNYNTSSTVITDTGTLTLAGTENSICVYADKTLPTNTSMTVNISDGTTTLSTQAFNTVLALTGFAAGTLKLTFNLATTDTTVTPTLKGYGVLIK